MNHRKKTPMRQAAEKKQQQPKRQQILIVSHPDGHVEVFGPRHIDVHIARVPMAFSVDAERIAEDVERMRMPKRYHAQWRADRLRATGTTRPLLPSTLVAARRTQQLLDELDAIADGSYGAPIEPEHPAIAIANRHAVAHRLKKRRAS